MRKLVPALVAASLLSTAAAFAQDVRIEPDAVLGSDVENLSNLQEVLNAFAGMIRRNGWRCDSISAARKFMFSRRLHRDLQRLRVRVRDPRSGRTVGRDAEVEDLTQEGADKWQT